MFIKSKGRFLFNITGFAIVAFWLVMIGMLVKELSLDRATANIRTVQPVKAIEGTRRDWKEIYLKDNKVGYTVSLIKPFEEGYYIQEEIFLKLNLMGLGSGIYTLTQARVNRAFTLMSFQFKMTSGVVSFNISGKVEGTEVILDTGKGTKGGTRRIKLSKPPMIGAGMGHFFESREISVGETFSMPIFDPSSMAQSQAVVRVVGREPVRVLNQTYDAFKLETEMWGKTISFWLDEKGVTLKEQGFMGLTAVKSSPARAPRGMDSARDIDFYDLAAVNLDGKMPKLERLAYLKLGVTGLKDASAYPAIRSANRQRFKDNVIEIRKEKLPIKAKYELPYEGGGDEMSAFLQPEFNIESDAPEIIEQANRILGDEKNPVSAARKLLNWVYRNLEKKPVVVVPSALEVLKTRMGDCNEHATLLTALLRASGIPAKISIGLIYTRGKFFYHAWTEAYAGEWISMDGTLNQMPVDVTHIKLIEGNLEKQVEIAGLMGALKLKILGYRHD